MCALHGRYAAAIHAPGAIRCVLLAYTDAVGILPVCRARFAAARSAPAVSRPCFPAGSRRVASRAPATAEAWFGLLVREGRCWSSSCCEAAATAPSALGSTSRRTASSDSGRLGVQHSVPRSQSTDGLNHCTRRGPLKDVAYRPRHSTRQRKARLVHVEIVGGRPFKGRTHVLAVQRTHAGRAS